MLASVFAGVSNPYLSQIERGLRRPSAEMLQAIARGLRISAETLYVRAGILDEEKAHDVVGTILADRSIDERGRRLTRSPHPAPPRPPAANARPRRREEVTRMEQLRKAGYAVIGIGDLAVEKTREVIGKVASTRPQQVTGAIDDLSKRGRGIVTGFLVSESGTSNTMGPP